MELSEVRGDVLIQKKGWGLENPKIREKIGSKFKYFLGFKKLWG